jgi:hypothetical protein
VNTEPTTHPLPEGRYGKQRSSMMKYSAARWVAGVLVAIACVLAAYMAYVNLGSDPITAETIGYSERPGNAMEVTFRVSRDDDRKAAVCIVRTRVRSGDEGGRKEVLVPPGNDGQPLRTVIKSTSRPVTANVFGCSYSVPEYLSRG